MKQAQKSWDLRPNSTHLITSLPTHALLNNWPPYIPFTLSPQADISLPKGTPQSMPITKERHHALAQAGKAWLEYSLVLRTALRSIHHAILSNESFTREQISGSIADLFSNFTLPDHEHAMTIERELALHQATRAKNERAKAAMRRYRLRVGAPTRAQAEPELNAQLIVDKALAKYKALQAADLETGLPLEPPRSPTPEVIPLDPAEAWAFGQGSADKEEDQDWLIDLELPEEAPSAQPRADENIE